MAKYRIEALSFIGNMLVQPGTEIETDDAPAAHWVPLDKPAKAEFKAAMDGVDPAADLKALGDAAAASGLPGATAANVPTPNDGATTGAGDLV
jgi:hypothetical protein